MMPYYIILYYAILYQIIEYYMLQCTLLYYAMLHYTRSYYIVSDGTMLHNIKKRIEPHNIACHKVATYNITTCCMLHSIRYSTT